MHHVRRLSYTLLLTGLLFAAVSCHKEIQAPNQTGNTFDGNFSQVFEDFWTGMNSNYVFWSIDSTNWDAMHARYAGAFQQLNLYDSADQVKAVGYFRQMVDGLSDSHYTLDVLGGSIQPAHDRKLRNPAFIENMFQTAPYVPSIDGKFYYTMSIDSLFLQDKTFALDESTPDSNFFVITGKINANLTSAAILYFAFNKFSLVSEYANGPAPVKKVLDSFFSQLQNPGFDGVIIDLRGNHGGDISDLNYLVGAFIANPLSVGDTRSKNGTGRLDYTAWAPSIVNPRPGFTAYTKPIVVLADGESVSMAELTTMSLKRLPNTNFVGDTTWGAEGPLTQNPDFNDGTFNFGNLGNNIQTGTTTYYGHAYTSSAMFRYADGKIYEGKGFPPDYDVKVTLDQIFLANHTVNDPQLIKAISLFTQ